MQIHNTSDIRIENLCNLWNAIEKHEPTTRQSLAQYTGLSLMSVGKLTDILIQNGAVRSVHTAPSQGIKKPNGRRAETIQFVTEGGKWLVLNLTDRHFRYSLFDLSRNQVEHSDSWQYMEGITLAENYYRFLGTCQNALLQKHTQIRGIAVVVPGPYDVDSDTIVNNRMPELNDICIKLSLSKLFGSVPVFVDEDVKLAASAYSEFYYEQKALYYLYIGEGVGGALVKDGVIFRGLNSVAGDPSLLTDTDGKTFEENIALRYFARTFLPDYDDTLAEEVLYTSILREAGIHRERYVTLLREAATHVSRILKIVEFMLDPSMIVIDCPYAQAEKDEFLTAIKELSRLPAPFVNSPEICFATADIPAPYLGAIKALERTWIKNMNY